MFDFVLKLFSGKPKPSAATRIQVVERELASLTIQEWRQDERLCAQSRNVLSSPLVRQMIGVLHNSHPAFSVISGDLQNRAFHQSRCEGYTMALADLEALGVYSMPINPLVAEFGEDKITEEEAMEYGSKGTKTA